MRRFLMAFVLLFSMVMLTGPNTAAGYARLPLQAPWLAGVGLVSQRASPCHISADQNAIDFFQDSTNTGPVLALSAADGKVVSVQKDCGATAYGCEVVIGHSGGYMTRYASLSQAPLVNAGEIVARGAPLGYIGTTSQEGGLPHLHFVLYQCNAFTEGQTCPESDLVSIIPDELTAPVVVSANYPVGYETISAIINSDQYRKNLTIIQTYWQYGGENGLLGNPIGPVQQLSGANIYIQQLLPNPNADSPWSKNSTVLVDAGGQGYLIIGPTWASYTNIRGGPTGTLGKPVSSTYPGVLNGEPVYRTDFEYGAILWFGDGRYQYWDGVNAPGGDAFQRTDFLSVHPLPQFATYLPPSFPGEPSPQVTDQPVAPVSTNTSEPMLSALNIPLIPTGSITAARPDVTQPALIQQDSTPVAVIPLNRNLSPGIIFILLSSILLIVIIGFILLYQASEGNKYQSTGAARLTIKDKQYYLNKSGCLIGRGSNCNLRLLDVTVSRQHARIFPGKNGWWIEDINSQTGVLINSQPVKRARLSPGDKITIGPFILVFKGQ